MLKKSLYLVLVLSVLIIAGSVCVTQTTMAATSGLKILTEEYPPISFMKNGKLTGFVTDIVREIMTRLHITGTITLAPWDEAYQEALQRSNVVLFSAERTEQRENLFQWVGPVGKNSAILYAKKGSGMTIDCLEDAKKVDAIATTSGWFTEEYLQGKGFKNLVSSSLPITSVQRLMNGEVQLSIFTDITVPEILKNAGYTLNDLEPVLTVTNTYFYIAMSRGMPLDTVKKWQSTLDSLKADGTFEKIYLSYIPTADLDDLLKK